MFLGLHICRLGGDGGRGHQAQIQYEIAGDVCTGVDGTVFVGVESDVGEIPGCGEGEEEEGEKEAQPAGGDVGVGEREEEDGG